MCFCVTGHVLPDVGGSVLGEGERLRGVDEVQEADERSALGSQPDPQPPLHALVVAHHQQSQRTTSSCYIVSLHCVLLDVHYL